ncbi:MAG: PAC2 family protein [Actinomycetota bacterium]|nr:PAC2 family protein [Actinomycetota bacterium]
MTARYVTIQSDPKLNDPVLIAAFRGWNDAGDAATFAAQHLCNAWGAEPLASIDAEDFYDFQTVRPEVELVDGVTRAIRWPKNEFFSGKTPDGRDVILLIGTEPNTKWRTFCELIVDLSRQKNVGLLVTLGALLADVPHSRPVHITGTALDKDLVSRLGLTRSRYEGPTGIVGVLHDAFSKAGVDSVSLWAAVPHYIAITPNPKAAMALVLKAGELTKTAVDVSTLELATKSYEDRVSEMVASDDDVQAYVSLLEERSDERDREEAIDPGSLPSGDSLAEELERFLRDRGEGT